MSFLEGEADGGTNLDYFQIVPFGITSCFLDQYSVYCEWRAASSEFDKLDQDSAMSLE